MSARGVTPVASVIVPVRNGAPVLARQLRALTEQSFASPFEVVVVNNQSTDNSLEIATDFASRFSFLRVIDAPHISSISAAVNLGTDAAASPLLLTTDQDDWVGRAWVEEMVRSLEDFPLVSGATCLKHEPLVSEYFSDEHFDPVARVHGAFLPFAMNCNMGYRRQLHEELNGFDSSMDQAQDIDFSWRAQIHGSQLGFAPNARLVKAIRDSRAGRFRQHLGYGRIDVSLESRFGEFGYRGVRTRAVKQLGWVAINGPRAILQPERGSEVAGVAGSALGVLLESAKQGARRPRQVLQGR